ncbi:hypothetical protein JOD97_004159 [Duganella sp. 1411]|uniref:hypothetical protein n=1 Tax=Duganella sp. 1411 TaxID=2806572 RepID=UPI001AE2B11D|nr:hypothetical protein [Duganella sp. 1411]MBP1206097.1 hypothetical protein [Duganella sp. 1411]
MDYISWSQAVVTKLVNNGFESALVHKVFDEAGPALRSEFEKGEFNSAGAHFVTILRKYDLDLEIAWERGQGRLVQDLGRAYQINQEEAHERLTRGFKKRVLILGWFRGEDVDLTQSANF